jgi:hypothetical protein
MYVTPPMVMPTSTRVSAAIPAAELSEEPIMLLPNLTATAMTTPATVMRSMSKASLLS